MDRVKLHAQERLDLDDARALQTLVYDYVQEALGGLLGHARGVLSVPQITQVENGGAPYITLSPFQFVTATPIESGISVSSPSAGTALTQFKTTVVTYDASEEASAQISIDNARAYYQDFVGAYLWARPVSIDTDQATRIRWSVSGGAEQTFSANTRESQRVAFVISTAEPTYATGEAKWARIALLTGWTDADNTDSLAQWQVLSVWEHDSARQWFGAYVSGDSLTSASTSMSVPTTSMNAYPMELNRSYRGLGIADQLAILRYKVAQMQGYGAEDPATTPTNRLWYQPPLISLNGADTAIDILTNERTSDVVCLATAYFTMQYTGDGYDYVRNGASGGLSGGISAVRPSPIRSNRACVEFSADLLSSEFTLVHVSVTQLMGRTEHHNTSGTYDYNRATFYPDLLNHWGQRLDDTTKFHLDDYATSSGRGINIEILPHYAPNEENISASHGGDDYVNVMIGDDTVNDNLQLHFSVAVYGHHANQ